MLTQRQSGKPYRGSDESAGPLPLHTVHTEQPLNRRRALRVLGALAAATAGTAVLSTRGPDTAEAAVVSVDYATDNLGSPINQPWSTVLIEARVPFNTLPGNQALEVNGSQSGVRGITALAHGAEGVVGESFGSTGILGQSQAGSGNTNVGVYGQAQGTSGGIGVLGLCSNDVNSVGVYAQSATGKGFLGFSNAVNGVGAVGVNSTSGIGLYGVSTGGFAGVFSGNLYVTGALTVVGAKSAAVKDAGGKLRRVYSMESPESWFEDFGSGQLTGGSATVQLEPGFAGLVHGDNYHVFPVANGDCNGLYVGNKTAGGFTIHELKGGTSNVGFSYRIVAKRKDIAGARLEHVDEPELPDVPEPVKPQTIPPAPATPRRGG